MFIYFSLFLNIFYFTDVNPKGLFVNIVTIQFLWLGKCLQLSFVLL